MSFELFAQIQALTKGLPTGVLRPLPAHRWDKVSINGQQVVSVTDHGVSFDVLRRLAKLYWTFTDPGDSSKLQTISGTIDVTGKATIALDSDADGPNAPANELKPRIAARTIETLQGVKISVEMIFELAGVRQDYRFDGVMWP